MTITYDPNQKITWDKDHIFVEEATSGLRYLQTTSPDGWRDSRLQQAWKVTYHDRQEIEWRDVETVGEDI